MVARGRGHLLFMSSLQGKAGDTGRLALLRVEVRATWLCRACATDLHASGVGVSTVFPGFIRDAGLFADSGVKLPPGVGTRCTEDVARAVVRAIERNRGEIDVAPLPLRAGAIFAGVAPELAANVVTQARLGGDRARGGVRPNKTNAEAAVSGPEL